MLLIFPLHTLILQSRNEGLSIKRCIESTEIDAFDLSAQIPKLLGSQANITGNRAHGDGVDWVMARDHQPAFAIAEDQVTRLTGNPLAQLLKNSDGFFLANAG